MTSEKQKALYDKYPKIFASASKPMTETCMCWGIECDDGWYDIIDALCERIQWHCDQDEYVPKHGRIFRWMFHKWHRFYNRFIDRWAYRHFITKAGVPRSYPVDDSPEYIRYSGQWKKLMSFRDKWDSRWAFYVEKSGRKVHPQVTFEQVKEKFGTLRVYTNGSDEYVHGLITMAEVWSARTCEACGSNHDVKSKSTGWIALRCQECRDDETQNYN
jgi:hypothetical protein